MNRKLSDFNQILRLEEVKAKTKLSKTTIYKMMQEKKFPQSIKLGERAVGWYASDIESFLADRIKLNQTLKKGNI